LKYAQNPRNTGEYQECESRGSDGSDVFVRRNPIFLFKRQRKKPEDGNGAG
jgi:hypothetical protein